MKKLIAQLTVFSIFALLAFVTIPALSQTTPTPAPAAVSPQMQAAVQAAVQAALAAGKGSLIQSVQSGTLQVSVPLLAQLSAVSLALNSLLGLLQGLCALAIGKPVSSGGVIPGATPPQSKAPSKMMTVLGWVLAALKLVGGNL